MASLPSSLHSPSGRGGEAARREGGRSDLRKKEQKRLAHTHKSETSCMDLQQDRCYAFKTKGVPYGTLLRVFFALLMDTFN